MLNLTINKPRNSNKIKLAPSSSFGIQVRSSGEHIEQSGSPIPDCDDDSV